MSSSNSLKRKKKNVFFQFSFCWVFFFFFFFEAIDLFDNRPYPTSLYLYFEKKVIWYLIFMLNICWPWKVWFMMHTFLGMAVTFINFKIFKFFLFYWLTSQRPLGLVAPLAPPKGVSLIAIKFGWQVSWNSFAPISMWYVRLCSFPYGCWKY